MLIPDVNVLIGAHRSDAIDHERFKAWLEGALNGDDLVGLSDVVLSGFLRVATNRRIFNPPSTIGEALLFADTLLSSESSVVIRSGERHWEIFSRICVESGARGDLVPDAYFAALAIESGSEWVTMDGDYARFPGLKWSRPL